jgi:hypothetical protein
VQAHCPTCYQAGNALPARASLVPMSIKRKPGKFSLRKRALCSLKAEVTAGWSLAVWKPKCHCNIYRPDSSPVKKLPKKAGRWRIAHRNRGVGGSRTETDAERTSLPCLCGNFGQFRYPRISSRGARQSPCGHPEGRCRQYWMTCEAPGSIEHDLDRPVEHLEIAFDSAVDAVRPR